MSDASARTVVLPDPIVPVMMSKDSVTPPLLVNHVRRNINEISGFGFVAEL
jgi:hypothetical protein